MTKAADGKHAYKSDRSFFAKCKVCGESMTHDNHFTDERSEDHPQGRWIRQLPKRVP